MPIYAYKCANGHMHEEERSMHDESKLIVCPTCNEPLTRDYSSLGSALRIRFRGKGEKYE
jgi:putative FmdB family regulatory protein